MKRFLLATALALTAHGLFFAFGPKLVMERLPIKKPQPLTVTFITRQAADLGPGPEIAHPVPSRNEVVRAPEHEEETPLPRQAPPPEEVPKPPEKAVSPQKAPPQSRPTAKADIRPRKREAKPPPKKPIPFEAAPEAMPEPVAAAGTRPVSPIEEVGGERVAPAPEGQGPTGRNAPETGEKAAAVPAAEKMVKARPAYRDNPRPDYPDLAKRRGHEGTVLLEVMVNSSGKVEELRIVKSSGYPVLDSSAMTSVKAWLFEPGSIGGRKVDMWVRVPVRFELKPH